MDEDVFEEYRQIFYDYLEKKRLSRTSERFAVMREVYGSDGHFDVEMLYERLKQKKYHVSRTTLYHTLELLEDCGLVRRFRLNSGGAIYERVFCSAPHDHILLSDGKGCIEFSDPRIDDVIRSLEEEHHVRIKGRTIIFYAETV